MLYASIIGCILVALMASAMGARVPTAAKGTKNWETSLPCDICLSLVTAAQQEGIDAAAAQAGNYLEDLLRGTDTNIPTYNYYAAANQYFGQVVREWLNQEKNADLPASEICANVNICPAGATLSKSFDPTSLVNGKSGICLTCESFFAFSNQVSIDAQLVGLESSLTAICTNPGCPIFIGYVFANIRDLLNRISEQIFSAEQACSEVLNVCPPPAKSSAKLLFAAAPNSVSAPHAKQVDFPSDVCTACVAFATYAKQLGIDEVMGQCAGIENAIDYLACGPPPAKKIAKLGDLDCDLVAGWLQYAFRDLLNRLKSDNGTPLQTCQAISVCPASSDKLAPKYFPPIPLDPACGFCYSVVSAAGQYGIDYAVGQLDEFFGASCGSLQGPIGPICGLLSQTFDANVAEWLNNEKNNLAAPEKVCGAIGLCALPQF